MPDILYAVLRYLDAVLVRNAPGASFYVFALRLNDLFDPDPAILSGSVSNFKEVMLFFLYYIVLNARIRWSFTNLESFPLNFGIALGNTNLALSIGSAADAVNAMENDNVTPFKQVSGKGGLDRAIIAMPEIDIGRLISKGPYKNSNDYRGVGLASPPLALWANFIVVSPTNASIANGFTSNLSIEYYSEFTGRIQNRA